MHVELSVDRDQQAGHHLHTDNISVASDLAREAFDWACYLVYLAGRVSGVDSYCDQEIEWPEHNNTYEYERELFLSGSAVRRSRMDIPGNFALG